MWEIPTATIFCLCEITLMHELRVLQPCFSVLVNVNDEGVAMGCVHSRRLAAHPKLSRFLGCSIRPSATLKIALFLRIYMQTTVKRKMTVWDKLLSLESMVLKLHEMLLRGQEGCSSLYFPSLEHYTHQSSSPKMTHWLCAWHAVRINLVHLYFSSTLHSMMSWLLLRPFAILWSSLSSFLWIKMVYSRVAYPCWTDLWWMEKKSFSSYGCTCVSNATHMKPISS